MRQVILDTSFIISCIKNKIDFFEELESAGVEILIPEEVIVELKGLKQELALKLLDKNKFRKIRLNSKIVDKGIINYAKENQKLIVATLDREIKKLVKNQKLVIRNKKKIEII